MTHEGALHLEDVLTRRTRVSMETPGGGVASAAAVAGIIRPLLGWDGAKEVAEVADYTRQAQLVARSALTARDDSEAARLAEAGTDPTLPPLGPPPLGPLGPLGRPHRILSGTNQEVGNERWRDRAPYQ